MAISGGIQGASQGAAMGSAFGPWGAAIGAGAGLLLGSLEQDKQDKARAKAIEEQAAMMRREMARAQGEIWRARTMEILNTAGAINHIKRVGGQIKADISVQNATADAIGASAIAAYSDAQAQEDQKEAQAIRALEYSIANQGIQLDSQLHQTKMSTRSMIEQSKAGDTSKQDMLSGLMGLASTGGSLWASGAFSKGATPKYNMQGQSKILANNPAFVRNM